VRKGGGRLRHTLGLVSESPRVPERVDDPVMRMRWSDLAFLHWPYEPDRVQRLLPPGLEAETFDGSAWVGLIPFRMTVRASRGPAVPWVSFFPETNVRTYVRAPDGTTGIWFFSLDAAQLGAVVAARSWLGLPYEWARMAVRMDGGGGEGSVLRYRCARHDRPGRGTDHRGPRPTSTADVQIGPAIHRTDVTDLEEFVTARFRLYSVSRGNLLSMPAEHGPWPLHRARTLGLRDRLVEAAGLPRPSGDPLVLSSPGVDVRVGRPTRIA